MLSIGVNEFVEANTAHVSAVLREKLKINLGGLTTT